MRVLQLTDHLEFGGLERIVTEVANAVAAAGGQSAVAAEPHGEFWDLLGDTVEAVAAPTRKGLRRKVAYVWWLRKVVKSGPWTVVHAHQRGVALMAQFATWGLGCTVIEHVHNSFSKDSGLLKSLLSFRGDLLVACGSSIAKMLREQYGRPKGRIVTVLNSVPDYGLGFDLVLPFEKKGGPVSIIGVGRLSEQKDPWKFLAIVEAIQTAGRSVSAVWVGDGEFREDLVHAVEARNLDDVSFVGFASNVPEYLREADLLLLPSRWEGLPLVVLEAMALGRVVVAHDVGSVRDVVEDGESGILLPVTSPPECIAGAIMELVDSNRLSEVGSIARTRYLQHGSREVMLGKLLDIYGRCEAVV